jgi:hypothetical protein
MDKRLEDKKIPDDGKKRTDASATAARNYFYKSFHKRVSFHHRFCFCIKLNQKV